jgi:hypothetical protein
MSSGRHEIWWPMFVRPRGLGSFAHAVWPTGCLTRLPPETLTVPVDAARLKAREILHQFPQGSYLPIVENWRQLPNGQIAFTIRHLPAAD